MAGEAVTPFVQPQEDEEQQYSPLTQLLAGTGQSPVNTSSAVQAPPQQQAPTPQAPTPQAPLPPSIDMQRWQGLQDAATKARQPIDPNAPGVKTKWYDRLLGGAVGFGTGFQQGAGAGIAAGGAVTNRKYNQALGQQQQQIGAADSDLGNFEKNTSMQRQDFDTQSRGYENQLAGQREGREQQLTDARVGELGSKGNKYDNTIDPASIRLDEASGKWMGHTFGDPKNDIETGAPKGYKDPNGARPTPKTYEEMVLAAQQETDPAKKAQYAAAAKQIQNTEVRKFQYQPRAESAADKPKRGTPGQFDSVTKQTNAAYAKAEAQYKSDIEDKVDPQVALATLNAEKARIGSENSERTRGLGGVPGDDAGARPAARPAAPKSGGKGASQQTYSYKGQKFSIGDRVMVDGKPAVVTGVDPKTQRPSTRPA